MDDSVFRWTAVEGHYSLNGASYVISVNLGWESIRSAIIYDDELAVTFTDPLGHLQWLVMPLVRTYDDVGNIELRGQDDSSDTGWRYVPFEFARGVPDLTPVKVQIMMCCMAGWARMSSKAAKAVMCFTCSHWQMAARPMIRLRILNWA